MKVTAYVQITALRDTLAEKQVIEILKCFTISAAPCMCFRPDQRPVPKFYVEIAVLFV